MHTKTIAIRSVPDLLFGRSVPVHRFKDIFSPLSNIVLHKDMSVRTRSDALLGTLEHIEHMRPSHTWMVIHDHEIQRLVTIRPDLPRRIPIISEEALQLPHRLPANSGEVFLFDGPYAGCTVCSLEAAGVHGDRLLFTPERMPLYIVRISL